MRAATSTRTSPTFLCQWAMSLDTAHHSSPCRGSAFSQRRLTSSRCSWWGPGAHEARLLLGPISRSLHSPGVWGRPHCTPRDLGHTGAEPSPAPSVCASHEGPGSAFLEQGASQLLLPVGAPGQPGRPPLCEGTSAQAPLEATLASGLGGQGPASSPISAVALGPGTSRAAERC